MPAFAGVKNEQLTKTITQLFLHTRLTFIQSLHFFFCPTIRNCMQCHPLDHPLSVKMQMHKELRMNILSLERILQQLHFQKYHASKLHNRGQYDFGSDLVLVPDWSITDQPGPSI